MSWCHTRIAGAVASWAVSRPPGTLDILCHLISFRDLVTSRDAAWFHEVMEVARGGWYRCDPPELVVAALQLLLVEAEP